MEWATIYCDECGKAQSHGKQNCIYCGAKLYFDEDYETMIETRANFQKFYNNMAMAQQSNYIPVTSNKIKRKKHRHLGMEITEEELLATGLYPHDKHGFFKGLLISNIFGKK